MPKIELDLDQEIIYKLEDNAESQGKTISEFLNCHLKNLSRMRLRDKNYYSQHTKKSF